MGILDNFEAAFELKDTSDFQAYWEDYDLELQTQNPHIPD